VNPPPVAPLIAAPGAPGPPVGNVPSPVAVANPEPPDLWWCPLWCSSVPFLKGYPEGEMVLVSVKWMSECTLGHGNGILVV
jgi:hypothetical protein